MKPMALQMEASLKIALPHPGGDYDTRAHLQQSTGFMRIFLETLSDSMTKVLNVRQWIRSRQYLLCRGERQSMAPLFGVYKPSFHDANGWHTNDGSLKLLTYGGIPSAMCVAFHPEVLSFRNGIFSHLRPTLWKLFSGHALSSACSGA